VTPESRDLNDWQVEEIRKGSAEADAGDFATPDKVIRVVKKWTEGDGQPPPFKVNDLIAD
jgi:predicted transcriptional regulator